VCTYTAKPAIGHEQGALVGRFTVGGERPDVEELTVTDEIKGKGASSGPITEIL